MELFKWSGAGNTFVVLDGRKEDTSAFRDAGEIRRLCTLHSSDGLMILGNSPSGHDFSMEFFNPDGSGGMMCGNGGRCITAFARYLGIPGAAPALPEGTVADGQYPAAYVFDAPDGVHFSQILSRDGDRRWTVRLGMKDVDGIAETPYGLFLDTGTRHLVTFVPDVEKVDVEREGGRLRRLPGFGPAGTNVNFVHQAPDGLYVRTFEKGVERETLACGTGITASAIASFHRGTKPSEVGGDGRVKYCIHARTDVLFVEFTQKKEDAFTDVFLTGPAELLLQL